MSRRRRLILATLAAFLLVAAPGAVTGLQPVVVIYATHGVPFYTLAQVLGNVSATAQMVDASSYGDHTLSPVVVGPFHVDTPCPVNGGSADAFGRAAEQAARSQGVAFPPGVSPWVQWDCGHNNFLYTSSIPNAKRGLIGDGKLWGTLYGQSLGLPAAFAEVIPYIGTNPFDPYTPMGYLPKGGYNAHERGMQGWIPPSLVRVDDGPLPGVVTQFVETTEWPRGTGIKLWRLPNGIEVDVRNFGLGLSTKIPASIVTLHLGGLLDLDREHLCRWYTLTKGQVYTRQVLGVVNGQLTFVSDGIGVRTESIDPSGSGAMISAFPYTGSITASCPPGTTK